MVAELLELLTIVSTKNYFRQIKLLPICETFGRAAFDTILSDTNCQKFRVYLSMATYFLHDA